MNSNKIIFVILVLTGSVIFYDFYLNDDSPVVQQEFVGPENLGTNNKPVYMSGCQTFHGPVKPKKIYPTVKKNFMALVCATEVYPPQGVIMLQRNSSNSERSHE